jgi:hypothetical protein
MSRSKAKGTAFESAVVRWLSSALGAEPGAIHRETLHGSHDEGDVGGIYAHGRRVVMECKNHSRDELPRWLREAEAERGNADALAGVVVSKRRGIGESRMGEQLVSLTLRDFVAIVTGQRPEKE